MKVNLIEKTVMFLALALASVGAFAQADVSSPYSMFGVGQMANKSMNVRLKGMGGVSNAMHDKGMINTGNPASYAKIDSLAFLFDAGFYFKTSTFSTSNKSEKSANASFDHVAMAFGLTSWWKMAIGVQPFSTMDYKMVVNSYDQGVGNYTTAFEGNGGLNRATLGTAFKIGSHFSVGANANYIFGDSETLSTLYFSDTAYRMGTRRGIDLMVSSFKFDYGLMYDTKIGKEHHLSVGLTYDQPIKLNGKQTSFFRSIAGDAEAGTEYLVDTILYSTHDTKLTMPQGVGFGVTFGKDKKWCVGADFSWTQWSKFAREGANDSLADAWSVAVGAEFSPTYTSVSNYFRKASYRIGGFYERTHLNINGIALSKFGATAGISLPLPRSLSSVNVAVEAGRLGTKEAGLIQEGYLKLDVGISVFERWFMKRKYK